MKVRPALVLAHRWFGLLGAIWLFLLGFTGAILVFYWELDHGLNPELFRPSGAEERIGFQDAVRAVEATAPGRRVSSVWKGTEPGDIWTVYLATDNPDETPEVYVDPATGEVRGERVWSNLSLDRAHLMPFLYMFHYTLQGGVPFTWLLGLVSLLWLLDHIVSAVLSFPNPRRWLQSFRIGSNARGHKLVFDLHRAAGLWLFPVTVVLAATGLYMNWETDVTRLIGLASERTPEFSDTRADLPEPLIRPPLDFDAAARAAAVERVHGIDYEPQKGLYVINSRDPRDLMREYGGLVTWLDARTGEIVSRRHDARGTIADVIYAWQLPLHSGKVFGWPGRIAVLASGIALCGFVVTGLLIWARKRRARRGSDLRLAASRNNA
jgi:uncharacterized iron-regulated membrane protein